ncbi:universal stress protein [Guyparkeria hydrothermalis]|uniref:universal stress protein n=1 Tax=Guyparkeria TaxID=2035712 RepID=UPI0010AC2281|nr:MULTISPECIES: universal stress protein [Guyparkeria]MCL7751755.1 universal stress protein [Guyparkeria hydrothermalis]TKA91252.1 universal stress protein [Guyparkeria sp. SB14A]
MYQTIMVPVDLAHLDALEKPLTVAADMARHYNAQLCYVGVTTSQPSSVARTPEEYEQKLKAFAREHAPDNGHAPTARVYNSHDPVTDLDDILLKAIDDVGADLVVMGTHLPHHIDAIMPANGSKVAAHSNVSVFLVRP